MENVDPKSNTFIDEWYRDNWGLWLVDLNAWTAEPLADWPLGSANIFFSRIDDRLFIHSVKGDFTSTSISEIFVDGTFKQELTVPGYAAYPLLKVQ